jgi:UDP-N-acetylmuramoylalanine--D-glutamate ligase
MDVEGKKISVVGLGRSGIEATRLLARKKARVFVSDSKKKAELKEAAAELEDLGVKAEYGLHSDKILDSEVIVVSPGVRSDLPVLLKAAAKGIAVISEVELAYSFLSCKIIAVTGTNGKTTTAALIHHILDGAGVRSDMGGNMAPGTPLSALVGKKLDFAVVEVSTFQLERIREFRPHVGVLTNIAPDHLDRHASFESYKRLKARLFSNQGPEDFAVLNSDDEDVMSLAGLLAARRVVFSLRRVADDGVWVEGREIQFRLHGETGRICSTSEVRLRGEFNLENSLAASAACILVGVEKEAVHRGLSSFEGVVHRLERVGEIDGVVFVNNSMCTNPTAAFRSLTAFAGPLVIIMGGKDKGFETKLMVEALARRAKQVVLIGEASARLASELAEEGYERYERAESMSDAVKKAYAKAEKGDTVLLSPGFASFDMFKNFEERGDAFKKAYRELESRTAR